MALGTYHRSRLIRPPCALTWRHGLLCLPSPCHLHTNFSPFVSVPPCASTSLDQSQVALSLALSRRDCSRKSLALIASTATALLSRGWPAETGPALVLSCQISVRTAAAACSRSSSCSCTCTATDSSSTLVRLNPVSNTAKETRSSLLSLSPSPRPLASGGAVPWNLRAQALSPQGRTRTRVQRDREFDMKVSAAPPHFMARGITAFEGHMQGLGAATIVAISPGVSFPKTQVSFWHTNHQTYSYQYCITFSRGAPKDGVKNVLLCRNGSVSRSGSTGKYSFTPISSLSGSISKGNGAARESPLTSKDMIPGSQNSSTRAVKGSGSAREILLVDPVEAKRLAQEDMGRRKQAARRDRIREIEAVNGAWAVLGLTMAMIGEGLTGEGILGQIALYLNYVSNFLESLEKQL